MALARRDARRANDAPFDSQNGQQYELGGGGKELGESVRGTRNKMNELQTQQKNRARDKRIYIPVGLRPHFQEYNPRVLRQARDANLIIERTLEFGTWREVQWLFRLYRAERIRLFLRQHGEHTLSRRTFNYWRKLLRVRRWHSLPFPTKRGELWQN